MLGGAAVFVGLAYVAYMLWFALVMWQAKGAVKWLFGAKKPRTAPGFSPNLSQWVRPVFMPMGLPAPA